MFKRAFDELDTIEESLDRMGMKEEKEEDVIDLVDNDTRSSSTQSSSQPLEPPPFPSKDRARTRAAPKGKKGSMMMKPKVK